MQQISRMLQMVGLLQSPLRTISVLVVHLLLVQFCSGQSQLIGSRQPIVATIGDDIILPCHLEPAMDVAAKTLEWTKTNLDPRFVYLWRASQDVTNIKNPSYRGRTSLFTGELKHGNISLKLSKVTPSDEGSYRCFIPNMNTDAFIQLVVASDAVSSPVIGLTGIDRNRGGVVLQCESEGWYPEPEVLWLDAEGHVLSAGPTETVRGPDGLYAVSSRVTVEKRHRNNFTCRVQQKKINQIRETQIHVPDDFFDIQSSFSSTVGLAASLSVCAVLIVLLTFFVWKWRQNIIKPNKEERENHRKNKTKDECNIEEEIVPLRTDRTEETKEKGQKNSKHDQQLQEKQRRQKTENNVETLKKDLDSKKKEVETKQAELQQLNKEKQRIEKEMQDLNEELEKKNKELETISDSFTWFNRNLGWKKEEKQKEKKEAEAEVERLKTELDTDKTELNNKMKEIENKQAKVEQLQEEIPKMEADLQTLMEALNNKFEVVELQRKLREEEEKRRRAEKDLEAKKTELLTEQQRREKAEKDLRKELETKNNELVNVQQRREKAEEDLKKLREELETKNNERSNSEASGNSQRHDNSSASQSSTTGPVIEVDRWGTYIRLTNTSKKDQQLKGWKLRIQINNTKPITHTFDKSFKLSYGEHVTLWAYSYGYHYPPTDLKLKDLKSWSPTDQLQIDLISNTGEIKSTQSIGY